MIGAWLLYKIAPYVRPFLSNIFDLPCSCTIYNNYVFIYEFVLIKNTILFCAYSLHDLSHLAIIIGSGVRRVVYLVSPARIVGFSWGLIYVVMTSLDSTAGVL